MIYTIDIRKMNIIFKTYFIHSKTNRVFMYNF